MDEANSIPTMDEANSVPTMMEVNQGVEEGFDSNHVPPMTESAPAVVTSQALPGASDQLQPLPSQKKRKPTRQPSEVWNHFEQYQTGNPSEPIRVRCKYCKTADYKYDPATCGTSSLRTHITNLCKKYPYRVPGSNQKVLSFAKDQSGSITALGAAGFNKEESRKACLRMVIIDELPFSFVDGEGFRHFCSVACPRFIPPSRRTLARDLLALYYDEKQLLKAKLAAYRVSLTTDTWTSVQNINYMVLTAHFLDDDWMLHKRVLNFCVIQNHKGRTIGRLIEKCLIDWGIERVLTITLDNASANDKAVSYLQNKMKDWPNGGLLLDGVHLHMRCCAHIVNLIVTDGLKELHNSVKSIRDAVMYVRSSPQRLETFKSCIEKDKIDCKGLVVLDVPTRWNSTYMMLEAALKFKKAFSRLEDEDGHFKSYFGRGNTPPVEEDWANAVVFVKFLKSFYEFTLRCSATLHATAHTTFHDLFAIDCELAELSVVDNPLLSNMAQNMKLKYDKYWGSLDSVNQFLLIAVVLDPRYKLDNLSMHIADLYVENDAYVAEKTTGVRDLLFKLYRLYEAGFVSNPTQSFSSSTTSSSIGSSIVTDSSNSSSFGGDRKKAMKEKWKKRQQEKEAVVLSHEIDRYLSDAAEQDIEQFDILNWWRVNASKYPVLAVIARDVLAIPVSTVASESTFSTGGRTINSFRSSLSPAMVEALICTQNWLKSTSISLQVQPTIEEMEFYETVELEMQRSNASAPMHIFTD
ncbi:hypothetical protein L3X38_032543 [Prunus dulcis]|uniref:BED-type domain-containing protein n=1 Tax=Prunus dulcis TaxID=3755 RepID=A0AAD4VFD4_PRUDU|nr:hypothetical protein L3X38_032543 [Prunus dulcis]